MDIEQVAAALLAPLGGRFELDTTYFPGDECNSLCQVGTGCYRVGVYWEDGASLEAVRQALAPLTLEVVSPAVLGGEVRRIELFELERSIRASREAELILQYANEHVEAMVRCWGALDELIAKRGDSLVGAPSWDTYMTQMYDADLALREMHEAALGAALSALGVESSAALTISEELVHRDVRAQVEVSCGLRGEAESEHGTYALAQILAGCGMAAACLTEVPAER